MKKTYPELKPNQLKIYVQQAKNYEISNGLEWYKQANIYCRNLSIEFNKPLKTVCGIIAAISPSVKWDQNKLDCKSILIYKSQAIISTYNKNKLKALLILAGKNPLDILGGKKVTSFYHNIFTPKNPDHVTIDRHISRLFLGLDNSYNSLKIASGYLQLKNGYDSIKEIYKTESEKYNILPNQLQAISWHVYRRKQVQKINDNLDLFETQNNKLFN